MILDPRHFRVDKVDMVGKVNRLDNDMVDILVFVDMVYKVDNNMDSVGPS